MNKVKVALFSLFLVPCAIVTGLMYGTTLPCDCPDEEGQCPASCPVEPPTVDEGRMTGGGSFFDGSFTRVKGKKSGTRFTHGFTLRCAGGPNNLQVNWNPPGGKGSFRFHLEELQTITCIDDPELDEERPVAGFDTVVGAGLGRLNGESGATIEFTFTDDGEPGKFADIADVVITSVGGVVHASRGALQKGNQQAHRQN